MELSAVTGRPAPPAAHFAGPAAQGGGLSAQDQVAMIAARPEALRGAALAAAHLVSPDAGGAASGRGSVDAYL
jgi:hypothetical protein